MSYDAANLWDSQCVTTYTHGYPREIWFKTPEYARAAYKAECEAGRAAELLIRGKYRSGVEISERHKGTKTEPADSADLARGHGPSLDRIRAFLAPLPEPKGQS